MSETTTSDELTEHGILTDHPDVTLLDYQDLHGEPWTVTDEHVIWLDETGTDFDEWAEAFERAGVSREQFSERMHDLARSHTPDDGIDRLGSVQPIVFDADTFRADGFEAIAMLLRRGCSPAEAIDWFATEDSNWSQSDWADWKGKNQSSVSENVAGAREELE